MQKYVFSDQRRRRCFLYSECRRISMLYGIHSSLHNKFYNFSVAKHFYMRHNNFTSIRNRCVETGLGRGVYRFFKLSRSNFRFSCSSGFLSGVRSSSWLKVTYYAN